MPGVNVSKATAIRRAKAWGCYKDEKPWQTFVALDTTNHCWEVGCMKKERPPFQYTRPTYYDEKIVTKWVLVDTRTGRVVKRKRNKRLVVYFN